MEPGCYAIIKATTFRGRFQFLHLVPLILIFPKPVCRLHFQCGEIVVIPTGTMRDVLRVANAAMQHLVTGQSYWLRCDIKDEHDCTGNS